jgi:hypothetical protein
MLQGTQLVTTALPYSLHRLLPLMLKAVQPYDQAV